MRAGDSEQPNNDIGAPLTLLRLSSEHQAGVIELGANHLGEIAWTSQLTAPQVAIITNVTGAHVGEFGGMGQIAQAKSEIFSGLSGHGTAVINRDDRYYAFWAACAASAIVSYGLHDDADVHARALSCDPRGGMLSRLLRTAVMGEVQLPLIGKHNVSNAGRIGSSASARSNARARRDRIKLFNLAFGAAKRSAGVTQCNVVG